MRLFSKNLRFLRKKGNHKQEDISIIFNKRANTIGNWENRKSEPSLGELMKLAEFFQVSAEDLLQKDLESEDRHRDPTYIISGPSTSLRKTTPVHEPGNSMTNEAGTDAFWLILRELRAVHEKVDLLVAGMESTGSGTHSDKSYH